MPSHDTPVIGIVSNCWRVQFDQGQSLFSLISEASQRGFRAIELRQGSLGEFESVVAEAANSESARNCLRLLREQFPEIEFDLAASLPIFGEAIAVDDPRFRDALAATQCVASAESPHLRLVDITTRTRDLDELSIQCAASNLSKMTERLIEVGGRLSVEHAYQSWSSFRAVLNAARFSLGRHADRLRCCFDPCNLLLTESSAKIPSIVESVARSEVSMIHLKQSCNGQILTDLSDGQLSWDLLLHSLKGRGHQGPWLFEVAPDDRVWDNLERSRKQLNA